MACRTSGQHKHYRDCAEALPMVWHVATAQARLNKFQDIFVTYYTNEAHNMQILSELNFKVTHFNITL